MAHYFESGYCVRKPAWHGLAEVHETYPENWDQAREWAGLSWDPEVAPVYARNLDDGALAEDIQAILENTPPSERAERLLGLFNGSLETLTGWQQVRRDDTRKTLGMTKTTYKPITHGDYGRIIETVLQQPGVKYETAGSVEGGACTWALAFLDEPVTIAGDTTLTLPYLVLNARHDGEGAARLQTTSVRVVCANTVRMCEAEADRNGTVFSFRHTANWEERMNEAREAVMGVRRDFAAYTAWANEMAAIHVTPKQVEHFVTEFVPMEPGITDRAAKNVEEARAAVRGILDGKTSEGISDTAFGLVQASAEWLDHYRRTRDRESLFRRAIMRPNLAKAKAIDIIREVVPAVREVHATVS
jgi:phage/plasmid-like protein (TIGR03299 family)